MNIMRNEVEKSNPLPNILFIKKLKTPVCNKGSII